VSVFWGANPVAIKIGLADAPPLRLAWMRFVLGASVVAVWAAATGRFQGVRVARGEWRILANLSLLLTLQVGIMNVGTSLTSAAHATIILNTYAVHTVVLAHFMIPGDRLTSRRLLGVLVAYGGTLALVVHQASAGTPTLLGDAIVMASALLLAERTVFLVRAVRTVDPVKLLLSQAVIGAAMFVVLSTLFEPAPMRWTWRLAAAIVYQGAVVAGFNFVVNIWLLQRYRPSGLAAFFLTQPLFGVLVASAITGERLTPDLLVAALALAAGIGLSREWRRRVPAMSGRAGSPRIL